METEGKHVLIRVGGAVLGAQDRGRWSRNSVRNTNRLLCVEGRDEMHEVSCSAVRDAVEHGTIIEITD